MYAYHQAKLPLKKTVQLELALTHTHTPPKKNKNKQTNKKNQTNRKKKREDKFVLLFVKKRKKILICNFCSFGNFCLIIESNEK